MNFLDKLYEYLWSLLPSNCEVCSGAYGVRGNETRIAGMLICDHCEQGLIRK